MLGIVWPCQARLYGCKMFGKEKMNIAYDGCHCKKRPSGMVALVERPFDENHERVMGKITTHYENRMQKA